MNLDFLPGRAYTHRGTAAQQAGQWFVQKWHARLAEAGDVQTVARQLRKQGVPVEIAVAVLATAPRFQGMDRFFTPLSTCNPCDRQCNGGRLCPHHPRFSNH
jgi:hypothetical protein